MRKIHPLALLILLSIACGLDAAQADAPITAERIALLPADVQPQWRDYLQRSHSFHQWDVDAIASELKQSGLQKSFAAEEASDFKFDDRRPDSWYATPEAAQLLRGILSYQSASGGWSKHVDMTRTRRPGERYGNGDAWQYIATFDNGATTSQMRFLAKFGQVTGQRPPRQAFLRALDYLLAAQYPTGGWPQVFPLMGGYHDAVTFNDFAMINVMELLREVAAGKPAFAFVDEAQRKQARSAVDRGIAYIISSQIIVNGQRTGWCAQHDPITFEAVQGRIYEKRSISGSETEVIARFLMSIDHPTPAVVQAVEGAVAWFERSAIKGMKEVETPNPASPHGVDRTLVPDPSAPDLWATFYEIETNRPIFSGRDGVVKYSMAEIDAERRNGYRWYLRTPRRTLKAYPAWRAKWISAKTSSQ